MGGIRSVGVVVDCDRCGKEIPVNDGNQATFYRAHAEREAKDVAMFIAILNDANGETKNVDFEYLCPKCCDAVFSYLTKIDTRLAPKETPKEPPPAEQPPAETPKEPPPAEQPKKAAKTKAKEPPPPPPPEQPGADFSDDDLFT